MARKNVAGPRSAANPPQDRPREGVTAQEHAWLAGVAWLNSLSQDDREAALASIRLPKRKWTPGAERVRIAREGLHQAIQMANALICELNSADRHDDSPLHLGLAVRVRDLADAADLMLTGPEDEDEEDSFSEGSRTIFGTSAHRAATTERAAS